MSTSRDCPLCGKPARGSVCTNGSCERFGQPIKPFLGQAGHAAFTEVRPSEHRQRDSEAASISSYRPVTTWSVSFQVTLLFAFLLNLLHLHLSVRQRIELTTAGIPLNMTFSSEFTREATVFLYLSTLSMVVLALVVTQTGWIYTSYRNLRALRATGATYSPLSAAILSLIPPMSLAQFWFVLLELWRGSDPFALFSRMRARPATGIYVTLVLFLVQIVAFGVIAQQLLMGTGGMEILTLPIIDLAIVIYCAAILQCLLIGAVVRRINLNQMQRYEMLRELQEERRSD